MGETKGGISAEKLTSRELEAGAVLAPQFGETGLITAVVQDVSDGEILMVAHMNQEALDRTIQTGQSHFWSRSRQELWHKGATSGDFQNVQEIRIDCDQDAVVLKVSQVGKGACHTGARSCFYRTVSNDKRGVVLEQIDG